jgi:membrane protease YdiL (CAAX protease family)
MSTLISLFKQHTLVIFCTLTIALTFATTLLPLPGAVIPVIMIFIPGVMAIALTAFSEGKAGVRSLLRKLAQWRIPLKWVAIALALALIIRLTMSLIALGLGMISAIQLRPGGSASYLFLAIVFFVFAIPEELGWRGYALSKLLERRSALAAGLIVGVFWGSLHLALLLPGMMNEGAPVLATLLGLIGGSVLFTWLYVNSNGNILLTTLFHAAQSFFVILNDGIRLEQQAWLMAVV